MKNDVVIQINSIEALERLIGDDPQIRTDLRNSVIQNFSKAHFKNIAIEISESAIENTMISEFEKKFKIVKDGYYTKTILKPDQSKALHQTINNKYHDLITDALSLLWKESVIDFNKKVQSWSDNMMKQYSEKSFLEAVDKAANEKIKNKLGLK